MSATRPRGNFAELATLETSHRIDAPPGPDRRISARAQFVAAGGLAAIAETITAELHDGAFTPEPDLAAPPRCSVPSSLPYDTLARCPARRPARCTSPTASRSPPTR